MSKKKWYKSLFENNSEKYETGFITKDTLGECDFLEAELNFNKSLRILFIGCGSEKHLIEMTKRGYKVSGIDLWEHRIQKTDNNALEADLEMDFQKQDLQNMIFDNEFDIAVMFNEGAFLMVDTDEMYFEILANISDSLKVHSKFIFTTLNGLFPLCHSVNEFYSDRSMGQKAAYDNNTFDLMTFREHYTIEVTDDSGSKFISYRHERCYMPTEITWLMTLFGFKKVDICGAKSGAYSRNDMLTTDDFKMLVIAER